MSSCKICSMIWDLFCAPTSPCDPPSASDCAQTAGYRVFWLTSKPCHLTIQTPVALFSQPRKISILPTFLKRQNGNDRFLIISSSPRINPCDRGDSINKMFQVSRNKDNEIKNYLIVYENSLTNAGLPCLRVHLLKDKIDSFSCVVEYVVLDSLDEYLLIVWKLSRRIFLNENGLKRQNQLTACIFCGPAAQHPIDLSYIIQILSFCFPCSDWLLYWPWSSLNNLQSLCQGDLMHLLFSAPNLAHIEHYVTLFWRYLAVFIINCLSRHNDCHSSNAFDRFKEELEKSRQDFGVFVNCGGGESLIYFLNGLDDLSDFENPVVLEILQKYLLPYVSPGDVIQIAKNNMVDLGVRILQEPAMCKLIADFEPEFIMALLEDLHTRQKNFRYLLIFAGHEGEHVLTDWLHFILPVYLDCLIQVGVGGREQDVSERLIRIFKDPIINSRVFEFALDNYLPKLSLLTSSMLYRAKVAVRYALRGQLVAMPAPRISLSRFIEQLRLPPRLQSFIITPAPNFGD